MKKLLAIILFPVLCWAGAVQHNMLTNTNALHGLHVGCYQGTFAGMAAVTNMWAGDCYDALDIQQKFFYQSSVPAPTPAYGTGNWVPEIIGAPYTPTPTP